MKAYDGECGPLGPYQWIIIILGIVVGSLLVVIIFSVISCKLWKKYGKKESSNESESNSEDSLPKLFGLWFLRANSHIITLAIQIDFWFHTQNNCQLPEIGIKQVFFL